MDTITLFAQQLPTRHPKVEHFDFKRTIKIKRRDYGAFYAHVNAFLDAPIIEEEESQQIKALGVTKWTTKLKNKRKKPTLRSICEVDWNISNVAEVKPRVFKLGFNAHA